MRTITKRILAIHDLSGFGFSSLMAVIPIMTAMEIQVCALPTVILSANTCYDGIQSVDMTTHLKAFATHWQDLDLHFDAVYSGFLGSPEQARIVAGIMAYYRERNVPCIVDPVMADKGELYSCFDRSIVDAMRQLIRQADVITPNLSEAALLLSESYPERLSAGQLEDWTRRLGELGCRNTLITGVLLKGMNSQHSISAYNSEHDQYRHLQHKAFAGDFPGSGDIFATVLTGALVWGKSLIRAIDIAGEFVYQTIEHTALSPRPLSEGIALEKTLHRLHSIPDA
ncbi:MAG: pyridoxamine kinase [Candidatus Cloacimonetes bacterium]|nr:pyridoxamine kinase [Candidatus Cloacimonadota bacterium]